MVIKTGASRDYAFALISSVDGMLLFQGGFLVAGIKDVKQEAGQLIVTDSKGDLHKEEVIDFEKNQFFKYILESWSFKKENGQTVIKREIDIKANFIFKRLISLLFKKAAKKHHQLLLKTLKDNPPIKNH
jgi:ribosomal protein L14E/L6E/L27E